MKRNNVIIDKEKLKKAYELSGCRSMAEMSKEIGHDATFISKRIGERNNGECNYLSKPDVLLIESKWGINVVADGEDMNKGNSASYRIPVDAGKLLYILTSNNLSQAGFGRSIGRSSNFFYDCTKGRGSMTPSDYEHIKLKYGIDVAKDAPTIEEQIKAKEEAEQAEQVEQKKVQLTPNGASLVDKLDAEKIMSEIKDAVYFGIKDGLIEIFRALKSEIN